MRLAALPIRHYRNVYRFAMLLLCLLFQPLHTQAQIGAPNAKATTLTPLKIAITPSPYGYLDKQGHTRGTTPDLVLAAAKLIGRKVEFIHMPYLRAVHELKTGGIDIMYGLHVEQSSTRLPHGVIASVTPHSILPLSLYSTANRGISLKSWDLASHYRVGSIRLVPADQRTATHGQGNTYYFKDVASLTKALLAKHIDLATLEPAAASSIGKQLGAKLERVFDYGWMQSFPLFSPSSPRIDDAIALCQAFIAARVQLFEQGVYATLLKANDMAYLLPYYNQRDPADGCRTTTP